jgi:hypothetical protein
MTDESNDVGPGALWALGNERLTAAADETRSYGERAAISHMAGLFFASSQARSLAILADHLAALVEQHKLGNILAALGLEITAEDMFPLAMGSEDVEAVGEYVRARIADLLDPDTNEDS